MESCVFLLIICILRFRFTTFFTYALIRFESDHGHEIIDIIIGKRIFHASFAAHL